MDTVVKTPPASPTFKAQNPTGIAEDADDMILAQFKQARDKELREIKPSLDKDEIGRAISERYAQLVPKSKEEIAKEKEEACKRKEEAKRKSEEAGRRLKERLEKEKLSKEEADKIKKEAAEARQKEVSARLEAKRKEDAKRLLEHMAKGGKQDGLQEGLLKKLKALKLDHNISSEKKEGEISSTLAHKVNALMYTEVCEKREIVPTNEGIGQREVVIDESLNQPIVVAQENEKVTGLSTEGASLKVLGEEFYQELLKELNAGLSAYFSPPLNSFLNKPEIRKRILSFCQQNPAEVKSFIDDVINTRLKKDDQRQNALSSINYAVKRSFLSTPEDRSVQRLLEYFEAVKNIPIIRDYLINLTLAHVFNYSEAKIDCLKLIKEIYSPEVILKGRLDDSSVRQEFANMLCANSSTLFNEVFRDEGYNQALAKLAYEKFVSGQKE